MNKHGAFCKGNCNNPFNIYHLVLFCGLSKGHAGDHIGFYNHGKVIWNADRRQHEKNNNEETQT